MSLHLLKGSTSIPRNTPPPPHIECILSRTPLALRAAISLWRNISVVFGKVVKRYVTSGPSEFNSGPSVDGRL
jgi:hypothetical protein